MNSLSISAWVRRARVLPLLAAWLAAGCSSPTGEVSGVVTYNGEPLPSGTVVFVGDGPSNSKIDPVAKIQSEGRYHLPQMVCGDVRITVQTPPAWTGRLATPTIEIPKKYADPQESGLTYTVTPGPQTFDIKLTGPVTRRSVSNTKKDKDMDSRRRMKKKGNQ